MSEAVLGSRQGAAGHGLGMCSWHTLSWDPQHIRGDISCWKWAQHEAASLGHQLLAPPAHQGTAHRTLGALARQNYFSHWNCCSSPFSSKLSKCELLLLL